MISHADVGPNVVINHSFVLIFRLQDQVLGRGGHEDAVTPGGAARVHVLFPLTAVLAVRVTGRKGDLQLVQTVLKYRQLFVVL